MTNEYKIKRYQLDPTGVSPDNLVKDELHHLWTLTQIEEHNKNDLSDKRLVPIYDNENRLQFYGLSVENIHQPEEQLPEHGSFKISDVPTRFIFPRYGAFYNDSIVIKHNGRNLILNQDYRYAFFWQSATNNIGKAISSAVNIFNPDIEGDIEITYQVVGGEYQDNESGINKVIDNLPFDERNVYWDEIIDKPTAYYPERHLHCVNDVFGLTVVADALENIRKGIQDTSVLKLKTVYDRFFKIKMQFEDLDRAAVEAMKNIDDFKKRLEIYKEKLEANIIDEKQLVTLIGNEGKAIGRIFPMHDFKGGEIEATDVAKTLLDKIQDYEDRIQDQLTDIRANIEFVRIDLKNHIGHADLRMNKIDDEIKRLKTTIQNNNEDIERLIGRTESALKSRIDIVENKIDTGLANKVELYPFQQLEKNFIDFKVNTLTNLDKLQHDTTDKITDLFNTLSRQIASQAAEIAVLKTKILDESKLVTVVDNEGRVIGRMLPAGNLYLETNK